MCAMRRTRFTDTVIKDGMFGLMVAQCQTGDDYILFSDGLLCYMHVVEMARRRINFVSDVKIKRARGCVTKGDLDALRAAAAAKNVFSGFVFLGEKYPCHLEEAYFIEAEDFNRMATLTGGCNMGIEELFMFDAIEIRSDLKEWDLSGFVDKLKERNNG